MFINNIIHDSKVEPKQKQWEKSVLLFIAVSHDENYDIKTNRYKLFNVHFQLLVL